MVDWEEVAAYGRRQRETKKMAWVDAILAERQRSIPVPSIEEQILGLCDYKNNKIFNMLLQVQVDNASVMYTTKDVGALSDYTLITKEHLSELIASLPSFCLYIHHTDIYIDEDTEQMFLKEGMKDEQE